jgi:uncharacterized membrane protein
MGSRTDRGRVGPAAVALAAVVIAGGALLYVRGVLRRRGATASAVHVRESLTIDRPAVEVYRFWRELENLPRVMPQLRSVREGAGRRSRWEMRAPAGVVIGWDAELVADRPGEVIAWRSLEGTLMPNEGSVRFTPIGPERTEVRLSFAYHPPAGSVGAALARVLGEAPSQHVREALRRLKRTLETGTVIGTDYASPSGRQTTGESVPALVTALRRVR